MPAVVKSPIPTAGTYWDVRMTRTVTASVVATEVMTPGGASAADHPHGQDRILMVSRCCDRRRRTISGVMPLKSVRAANEPRGHSERPLVSAHPSGPVVLTPDRSARARRGHLLRHP
jgi:hypothetical protein